jgi:hypothetical protein
MPTQYIVMREWITHSQQRRRLAAGPFTTRARAETFARKAREEWSNVSIVPLRPARHVSQLDQ